MLNKKSRLEKTLEKMMSPKTKSEFEEQVAVMDWANKESANHPELSLAFHIPNGGRRSLPTATRLKRAGVKAGMPDICLPVPVGMYSGLWIEMKTTKGRLSEVQSKIHNQLRYYGHRVEVCVGVESAKAVMIDYING